MKRIFKAATSKQIAKRPQQNNYCHFCGGIYGRGVCKLTKKQWIKVGLNPNSIYDPDWLMISKCADFLKGKCSSNLEILRGIGVR